MIAYSQRLILSHSLSSVCTKVRQFHIQCTLSLKLIPHITSHDFFFFNIAHGATAELLGNIISHSQLVAEKCATHSPSVQVGEANHQPRKDLKRVQDWCEAFWGGGGGQTEDANL